MSRPLRLVAAVLAITTSLAVMPNSPAHAAAYTGLFTFTNDGTEATVTGCASTCFDKSLVIPSTDGSGHPVRIIGSQAFMSLDISSVTLPNGLRTIEYNAFAEDVLESVTIPPTVTTIGDNAFSHNQLTSVVIPNSVTSVGYYAFANNLITSVTIGNGITTLSTGIFLENRLTSFTIPSFITAIGGGALASNKLTSITIPSTVTTIGSSAFASNQLTSFDLPSSVTSFGGNTVNKNPVTSFTFRGPRPTKHPQDLETGMESVQCVNYVPGQPGWPGATWAGITPTPVGTCTPSATGATTSASTSTSTVPNSAITLSSAKKSPLTMSAVIPQATRIARAAGLVVPSGARVTTWIVKGKNTVCKQQGAVIRGLSSGKCVIRAQVRYTNGHVKSKLVTLTITG